MEHARAINIDQVLHFVNTQKPAILCLQETRLNEENYHLFQNIHYRSYQDREKGDLSTFVRKDIKANLITDTEIKDITYMLLSVHTEGEYITITDIYAKDSKPSHRHLRKLSSKYKNIVILGDLDAKHNEILDNTQITPHIKKGIQLNIFLDGKETITGKHASTQSK